MADAAARLLAIALRIADEAPATPTPTARRAYVRWDLITELRRALADLGVPGKP